MESHEFSINFQDELTRLYTFPTVETWDWGWDEVEFRLRWSDVDLAAKQIIAEIEKLIPESGWVYEELNPRLPFFQEQLRRIKKLMDSAKIHEQNL